MEAVCSRVRQTPTRLSWCVSCMLPGAASPFDIDRFIDEASGALDCGAGPELEIVASLCLDEGLSSVTLVKLALQERLRGHTQIVGDILQFRDGSPWYNQAMYRKLQSACGASARTAKRRTWGRCIYSAKAQSAELSWHKLIWFATRGTDQRRGRLLRKSARLTQLK